MKLSNGTSATLVLICVALALNSLATAQICDSSAISRLIVIDPSHNGGMIAWHGDMNATYAIVKNNTSGIPQLTIKDVKVIGTFAGADGNTTVARMNISWNEIFALEWMEVKNENGQVIAKVTAADLPDMKQFWNPENYPAKMLYREGFGQFKLHSVGPYPKEYTSGFPGFANAYGKLVGY